MSRFDALRAAFLRAETYIGCGDGSCLFRKPRGMHTNGGCRCKEILQRPFVWQAIAAVYREVRKLLDAEAE